MTNGLRRHLQEPKTDELHEADEAPDTPMPGPVPVEPLKADVELGSDRSDVITQLSEGMADQTTEAERMRQLQFGRLHLPPPG